MEALIERLRKMTATTESDYTDEELQERIEEHALRDKNGYSSEDADWTPTYDLNHAAADIWGEKASELAEEFDFNADGGSYATSQKYKNAMQMAAHYRSRSAMVTATVQTVRTGTINSDFDEDGSINETPES